MIIAAGRPGVSNLTWWVLSEDGQPPVVEVHSGIGAAASNVHQVRLPGLSGPAAYLVVTDGLAPDTPYSLAGEGAEAWSRTLPRDPLPPDKPFTVAFGSCYCVSQDTGISAFYPPPGHLNSGQDPIRLRFLGGDQIYLDLSEVNGDVLWKQLRGPDPWIRYLNQWRRPAFREFLEQSPNLTLADDHEFWNDYPHQSFWLSWSERGRRGNQAVDSDRAFSTFQAALNLDPDFVLSSPGMVAGALNNSARTFQLDVPPLSFFVLDIRTQRGLYDAKEPRFMTSGWRKQVLKWINTLTGPGVLILAQPLVEDAAGWFKRFTHTMGDVNLPDYSKDFATIWEALFSASHDVLVVSGDIHWSRSFSVKRSESAGPVYEVIASPLARIPKLIPSWVSSVLGMNPDIEVPQGKVEWSGGNAYWGKRYATAEAPTYSTLSFTPQSGTETSVKVEVTAWNREGIAINSDAFYLNSRRL